LPLVDWATNGKRAPSPAIGRYKVSDGRGYLVATHWGLAYTRRRKGNKRRCRFRVFDAFAHSRPSQRGGGWGPPPLVAIYSAVFFIVCTCSLSILENCQSWWSRFSKRTNYKIEREAWQPSRLPKYSLSSFSRIFYRFFLFMDSIKMAVVEPIHSDLEFGFFGNFRWGNSLRFPFRTQSNFLDQLFVFSFHRSFIPYPSKFLIISFWNRIWEESWKMMIAFSSLESIDWFIQSNESTNSIETLKSITNTPTVFLVQSIKSINTPVWTCV